MVPKKKNSSSPHCSIKPFTVSLICLTLLWALFQWKDPTPPPVLDQILVAAFGVWLANEAIDKKNGKGKRTVKIGKDGSVSVSDDDTDDDSDDDTDSQEEDG